MEYPIAELVDRVAIFAVKAENGLSTEPQRDLLLKEVPVLELKKYLELMKIHRAIWNMEEMITVQYSKNDFSIAGKIYKEIREFNIQRSEIKNSIALRYNGFQDIKNFRQKDLLIKT
ncbi:MAG: hypothetical protein AAB738_01580 [Patescibacteria group bacterium]